MTSIFIGGLLGGGIWVQENQYRVEDYLKKESWKERRRGRGGEGVE